MTRFLLQYVHPEGGMVVDTFYSFAQVIEAKNKLVARGYKIMGWTCIPA